MTDGSVSGQQTIWADNSGGELVRNVGATASERYLGRLCDRSFLSLWSYSGIYRYQAWLVVLK
jgi:hypothetical protein